jgi:hypothetical protein
LAVEEGEWRVGFEVEGPRFRSGFKVQGSEFRVHRLLVMRKVFSRVRLRTIQATLCICEAVKSRMRSRRHIQ